MRNNDTLSIEGLASKYEMPILANMALERLHQNLNTFLNYNWNPEYPEDIDTGEDVTDEFWQIAERGVHWKHAGVLDTCMDIITHPLQFSSKQDGVERMFPGMIVLPERTSSFSVLHQGVVLALCKAVNKALLKKARIGREDVPEGCEVAYKYLG